MNAAGKCHRFVKDLSLSLLKGGTVTDRWNAFIVIELTFGVDSPPVHSLTM